jgi:hypothetical protein
MRLDEVYPVPHLIDREAHRGPRLLSVGVLHRRRFHESGPFVEGRALIIGAVLTTNSTYDTGAHPSGHKRHAIPEVEAVSSCYQFATSGSNDGRTWADWEPMFVRRVFTESPISTGRYWRADAGTRTPDPFITSKTGRLRTVRVARANSGGYEVSPRNACGSLRALCCHPVTTPRRQGLRICEPKLGALRRALAVRNIAVAFEEGPGQGPGSATSESEATDRLGGPMGRRVGIAVFCCLAISGFPAGGASASAARRRSSLIARIAQDLAASIRQDARARGPSAPTEVKTTTRCCGRQLLAVFYRAPSERFGGLGQFGVSGGYELQLETAGRTVRGVKVSSLTTEKFDYRLGERAEPFRPFAWSISHSSRGPQGWMSEIGYSYGTFGWEVRLPDGTRERAPAMAAFRLALTVIRKAQRHERVIAEAPPWAIEGLRHAGSFYWGKTAPTPFLWEGTRYPGHAEPIEIMISATGEAASVRFPAGIHEPLIYCAHNDGPVYKAAASTTHPAPISSDGSFTAMVGEKPDYPVQVVSGRFVGGEVSGTVQTFAQGKCGGTTTFAAIVGGPAG